ncbi:LPS assembly lipoprotein LptE [Rhodobacteraceae bacterium DSL-40]|uniref:LPS assembly lipoprotein LptE n=1 Tax=Amaricoccus sp. B4 TaxID=3368557 RepID=UPI000DACBE73
MWSSDRRGFLMRAGLAGLAPLLSACGFEPMYGEGSPARAIFGQVAVDVIPSAEGYTLRERLIERLGPAERATHRLEVDLEVETVGVTLTTTNVTTRFDVIGVATYRLIPIGGARPVFEDRVRAIAGFSAPESETASAFASRAAEENAIVRVTRQLADDIVQRLALDAANWAEAPGVGTGP